MKYLKIGIDEICAFAIIAFAIVLRIILASQNWPPTNSDEGTMGLMARHIAYGGEYPIVFYGQTYMGALEAYIAAAMFHLFGPSLFTLRLSVILLIAFFFVSMYLLTSALFTKKLALVTLAVLSLGSSYLFTRELITTGGSAETLLFGSLAFLLSFWLALSYGQYLSPRRRWLRLVGYGCWGLVVGLGLWSDLVVLPFFVMASLLLILFCWRELRSWAPLCLLLGLLIGAFPLLVYNYNALHGADSLSILVGLFHGSTTQAPRTLPQVLHAVKETILISIPAATGNPFCPVSELPWIGESSPPSLQCTAIHEGWGLGYMLLLTIAALLAASTLWQLRDRIRLLAPARGATTYTGAPCGCQVERQIVVRHVARFMLLGSAVLAIGVYALSSGPVSWPGIHARYLIGLLIVTPAVIAPLWSAVSTIVGASACLRPVENLAKVKVVAAGAALLVIGTLLLIGTINTFREIPANNVTNQQQEVLINDLLRIGATHIYTDYWTCDRIAFISNERIICGVLDPDLIGTHNNRYMPYLAIVEADPHSAYVFRVNSPQAATMAQQAATPGMHYHRFLFDGYIVYQPV
jgi:hypothetical protein